jgi:hypothetical protein
LRTAETSLFRIELSRAEWVIAAMLGETFGGILCSDYYSVYTAHDDWIHAYCSAHTIRAAKQIAELSPCPVTEEFQARLRALYRDAEVAQASADLTARRGFASAWGASSPMDAERPSRSGPACKPRLNEHFHGVLTFLITPKCQDNNATERDIRTRRPPEGDRRHPITQRQSNARSLAEHHSDSPKERLAAPCIHLGPPSSSSEGRPPPPFSTDRLGSPCGSSGLRETSARAPPWWWALAPA